ncbi:MAG TPA: hypothetical protein VMW65_13840 [Chloroflexota bacterium]|nr:hypothetical protein [Chloroflexota bacterium]
MTSPAPTERLNALRAQALHLFGDERAKILQPDLEIIAQALAALWQSEIPWQANAPDFLSISEVRE